MDDVKSILVKNGIKRSRYFDIKFFDRESSVIGEDGGYDNFFLNYEEFFIEDDFSEDIFFTEEEREFVF